MLPDQPNEWPLSNLAARQANNNEPHHSESRESVHVIQAVVMQKSSVALLLSPLV